VLHGISLPAGTFGGDAVINLFLNQLNFDAHPSFCSLKGIKVSAHFLIRRDGEIFQFVPVTMRAWHAGISSCLGRTAVNDFSIGVELEGTDANPYEEAQYRSLARLNQSLIREFPAVTAGHLFGHSDIAPDRKSDPGPCFDWTRCRRDALSSS
jgi:AmpD protein